MHMADALLSPAVGGAFIAASGAALAVSARKISAEADDRKVPLMGVMGAFVFAAQMVNFSIPATGSSGHLGGGMLLAILLGPYAAFLTIASVLIVQALLFADGGLLALGTNVWNLGFYPCFLGLLIYKAIAGRDPSAFRRSTAAMTAAVAALEMGAFSVALQTALSGRSDLPLGHFAAVMLGIHLPIGLVEGLATVAVVNFIARIRPELMRPETSAGPRRSLRPVLAAAAVAAVIAGGGLAWFASTRPDGLEWSVARVAQTASNIQEKDRGRRPLPQDDPAWPEISARTSASGLVGSAAVLSLAGLAGLAAIRLRGRRRETPDP